MPRPPRLAPSFLVLVFLCACGGGGGGGGTQDHAPVIDTFTVASSAVVGAGLQVAGAAHDPDGDAVAYAWTVDPTGCGAFAAPAAAATTFTPAAAGSCTVRLTVTAGGKTVARSGAVTVSAPCTGPSCAPQHHFALDPAPAPAGVVLAPNDTGARAVLIEDRAPGAAGDILGLFYNMGGSGAVWYLVR